MFALLIAIVLRRPIGRIWLAANVTHDIPAVIAAMFDEAERRDPMPTSGPGSRWSTATASSDDRIRDQATARGVTVTVVIDFVHVLEYLWKARLDVLLPGRP